MKKILSFLLSVVFLHVQTAPLLAKRGGPSFDDQQNVDIVGTYSGSLIPDDPEGAATQSLDGNTINSVGLFSLGIPAQGPGTGSFVVFTQGIVFSGTITGVGDPGKGTLSGILEGSYDFTDFVFDANGDIILDPMTNQPVIQNFTAIIRGALQAEVTDDGDFDFVTGAGTSLQRIDGSAQMGIILRGDVANRVLSYTVDGVKQTSDVGNTGSLVTAGSAIVFFP
jgi:hypothetical protein